MTSRLTNRLLMTQNKQVMKKVLFALCFLFLVTTLSVSAFAREENANRGPTTSLNAKNKNTEAKDLREDLKASASATRQQFKERLQTIKNDAKRQIIEKLTEKMNRVNSRRVDHWRKILARLTDILDRIKATDKHSSELDAAVSQAEVKLASASAAVEAQSTREYTVNIASESALKINAGKAISAEQHDFQSVLKQINDAKQSVHKALMLLKRTFGGPLRNEASPLPKVASGSATEPTEATGSSNL